MDGGDLSYLEDEHQLARYSAMTFKITKNYDKPVVLTCHQFNKRFIDKDRRSYEYAHLKLILAKFVKERVLNPSAAPKEQEEDYEMVAFVDADFEMMGPHAHIELPSLSYGEYIVVCKGTWYPHHT